MTMTTTTQTNALDIGLAAHLSEIEGETIVSLVTRKKGKAHGKGDDRKTYGNDLVHVLVWAGWDYTNLVKLSLAYLRGFAKGGRPVMSLVKESQRLGYEGKVTAEDACLAIQEIRASFYDSLAKNNGGGAPGASGYQGSSKRAEHWRTLEVNGAKYPTLKVYIGPPSTAPRAPIPGHIYLHGLKLGEKIIESSNGIWRPNSSLKVSTAKSPSPSRGRARSRGSPW